MANLTPALKGVAQELAKTVESGQVLGLGSGSTVAGLLDELAPLLLAKKKSVTGVPTSSQIELVATRNGIKLSPFTGAVDLALDGADQVDAGLNLIKGGGGALLREKVVMGSAGRIAIVASGDKFVHELCERGVKVPLEVVPLAKVSAKRRISELGGLPEMRMLQKGFPYFTENGNVILDAMFEPIDDPPSMEAKLKNVPGIVEVGIFTFKPVNVFRLQTDGNFDLLK